MLPSSQSLAGSRSALAGDLLAALPELLLASGVVAVLLARVVVEGRRHVGPLALGFAGLAFAASVSQWLSPEPDRELFTGLAVHDRFTVYLRMVLTGSLAAVLAMSLTGRVPDAEDSADFSVLLLGATLGMVLMAAANHLLTAFLAVEMASLPSYAAAGFLKGRRASSEAALKYVIFGSAASGVMLYGISLVVVAFGTGHLTEVAAGYGAQARAGGLSPMVGTGTVLILVGLGYKLAAVPFHYWCPDVFEGSSAEVAGFLSVASKAAAVALVSRLALTLTAGTEGTEFHRAGLGGLAAVSALTMTFGNLAAYGQTNMKRLLAYSTIAHAGTMLMGVATLRPAGAAAAAAYLPAYALMNLGAFGVVALVRDRLRTEDLEGYRGLMARSPAAGVTLTLFLAGLLGLPPLAGFAVKFQVFAAVYRAAEGPGGPVLLALLAAGVLNTVLSSYYYFKVARAMALDDPEDGSPVTPGRAGTALVAGLAGGVVALGLTWGPLAASGAEAARSLGGR